MNRGNVESTIVYGDMNGTPQNGCFVEVRTWDDNNHICIDLANNGKHVVWNFDMKDKISGRIKDEIEDICDYVDEVGGFSLCISDVEEKMYELFENMYDEWFED